MEKAGQSIISLIPGEGGFPNHQKSTGSFDVMMALATGPRGHNAENAQEKEAVGDIKPVVIIPDIQELAMDEIPDDAAKHQDGAENTGYPAYPVYDLVQAHG